MTSARAPYRSKALRPEPPPERIDSARSRFVSRALLILMATSSCVFVAAGFGGSLEHPLLVAMQPTVLTIALSLVAFLPSVSVGEGGIDVATSWRSTRIPWSQVMRIDETSLVARFVRFELRYGTPIRFFARSDSLAIAERYLAAHRAAYPPDTATTTPPEPLHSDAVRFAMRAQSVLPFVILAAFVANRLKGASVTSPSPSELAGIAVFAVLASLVANALVDPRVLASEVGLIIIDGSRERRIPWSRVAKLVPPSLFNRNRLVIELVDGESITFIPRRDATAIATRFREMSGSARADVDSREPSSARGR